MVNAGFQVNARQPEAKFEGHGRVTVHRAITGNLAMIMMLPFNLRPRTSCLRVGSRPGFRAHHMDVRLPGGCAGTAAAASV
jgi:hypothetical protein